MSSTTDAVDADDSTDTKTVTTTLTICGEPVTYEREVLDDVDETAVRTLQVTHGLGDLLAELAADGGVTADPATDDVEGLQRTVDRLEAALQAGRSIRESPRYEAFLHRGPEALPNSQETALREDLAPVADALGADLELTPPEPVDLREYLPAALTGRGS